MKHSTDSLPAPPASVLQQDRNPPPSTELSSHVDALGVLLGLDLDGVMEVEDCYALPGGETSLGREFFFIFLIPRSGFSKEYVKQEKKSGADCISPFFSGSSQLVFCQTFEPTRYRLHSRFPCWHLPLHPQWWFRYPSIYRASLCRRKGCGARQGDPRRPRCLSVKWR